MRADLVAWLLIGGLLLSTVPGAALEEPLYEGKPLSYWVDQLKLGFRGSRISFSVFEKLGTGAAPALPALTELLKHPDHEVRIMTVVAVTEVAKALVRASRLSAPPDNRQVAALKPLAQPLVSLLGDADAADKGEVVASSAKEALYEMGAVGIPEITLAAKDKTRPLMLRARAIQTLGRIGPAAVDSLPSLRQLFSDKTEDALIRGESNAAIKKIEGAPE